MWNRVILPILVALVASFSFSAVFSQLNSNRSPVTESGSVVKSILGGNILARESLVVETVKRVNPAVVSITVTKNVPVIERYYRDPFSDFFSFDFFPFDRDTGDTEQREVGGGSGFIVSAEGLVVTNAHVVEDDDAEYTVFTNDGESHEAEVIASDESLDIAVIKIKADEGHYPYLEFGNSDELAVGETVIAIGNALGEFRNTVSVGVVSGLARSIVAGDRFGRSEALDQVIQTDAAINPGNSGGPLLNLRGEVVGVNVAVAVGSENIGFALPANSVKQVVQSVKETGKIVRPFLGVRYLAITPSLQKKNDLPVDHGVLIQRGDDREALAVIPGSPADKAGLVENDIILEIDGVKLTPERQLTAVIRNKKVGDQVKLKILHRRVEKLVTVKLEAA